MKVAGQGSVEFQVDFSNAIDASKRFLFESD